MRTRLQRPGPARWRLLDRWAPVVALSSFAMLLVWGTAGDPSFANAQAGKDKKKNTTPALTRPVPGAGTTVNIAGLAKIIDDEINLKLKQEKLAASPQCDDATFIRRAYLDLTGVIPPVEKVKAFLDSKDPNKREKLIDELLQDPNWGKQLSEIWTAMMIPQDSMNRILATENLRKWLEEAFNQNKPWNKLVEELVTATGTIDDNGATIFFVANDSPDKVTGQVTKLFMGVQLQCAQCHNHPFTGWKQEEYWGMAAFFTKVKQDGNAKAVAKNGGTITITEGAGGFGKGGKKGQPEGFKNVPAKFLGAEQPKIPGGGPARPVLARWMTSPDNPYFARAAVNRMWAHFFGRGLITPVDDMRDDNPASHPELLAALAEQFSRNGFDLKYLAKAIMLSEAYQRSSRPAKGNESDTDLYSHAFVRTMSPEQLFDSIATVVGTPKGGFGGKGPPMGGKGAAKGGPRGQFIAFFRVEDGADPLEYQDGIPQALRLMNSPLLNNGGKALEQAMTYKTQAEAIDYLYLSTLSRHATAAEMERRVQYVGKQKSQRQGYTDILWALLNSSEFRLNH
jgi:hypothetical protein